MTTVDAPDPFERARRDYNDRTADLLLQRRNALWVAGFSMLLALLAVGGLIAHDREPRMIPYVVRVNDSGEPVVMGGVPRLVDNGRVDPRIVQFIIADVVSKLRMVTFDPVFEKEALLKHVEPFVDPASPAAGEVNAFLKADDTNPLKRGKVESVTVDMDRPVPQTANGMTYELQWSETERNRRGDVTAVSHWHGFATIKIMPVGNDDAFLNPAGIFLEDVTWTKSRD